MTHPNTQPDVMTLEETQCDLHGWLGHLRGKERAVGLTDAEKEQRKILVSALHHLEAGKQWTEAELCHVLFWHMTCGKCEGWCATQRKGILLMLFDEKTVCEGTSWSPKNIGDVSGWTEPQPSQQEAS